MPRLIVPAADIVALVDAAEEICKQAVTYRSADITGDLDLSGVEFKKRVVFEDCQFSGNVNLSFTKFRKGLAIEQCRFGDVLLRRAEVEAELRADNAVFAALDASGLCVEGPLYANFAQFGKATFDFVKVAQTFFLHAAQFDGVARFDMARIDGGLEFAGEDGLPATVRAWFKDEARFIGATVKGYAIFNDVQFDGLVNFDSFTVEGDVFFERCLLAAPAPGASQDYISFLGVRFLAETVFDGAQFGGKARFDQSEFRGDPLFAGVRFGGDARFNGAVFAAPLRFDARSTGLPPASFHGKTDFAGVTAGDIRLDGVRFEGPVSFRDASFKKVFLGNTDHLCSFPSERQGTVDLVGMTYDRVTFDKSHLEILKRIEPFDLQPYRQAEKVLRAMGQNDSADEAYLIQRRRTLWYYWRSRQFLKFVGNFLYSAINFGVGWRRLVLIPAVLFALISLFIFQQPGSLHVSGAESCKAVTQTVPSWAAGLSYFLPVELPATSCTAATEKLIRFPVLGLWLKAVTWATLLKVAGWIFVPLWVAALAGLLHRDPAR